MPEEPDRIGIAMGGADGSLEGGAITMNHQNGGPNPEFIAHGRDLDVLIAQGVALHGHLGPYLVSGIRMGLLALDLLGCS